MNTCYGAVLHRCDRIDRKLLRSRGSRPGYAADENRGGAERRAVGALYKRWVTARRSSLGDFGHSRLALRHEGSDRHRGYHPTDPTGEGCPSSHRAGCLHPFGRSVPVPERGRFIQLRPAGLPLRSGADESPASRKAEGKNPPDLRSPSPSRVHRGAPFSCAP